jgi:hypothetical protein
MERVACMAFLSVALATASAGCMSTPAFAPLVPSVPLPPERVVVGLASVPALPLEVPAFALEGDTGVHDVVANGHDSCPDARSPADPLRYRYPPCPQVEAPPPTPPLVASPAFTQAPEDDTWNLHLRGLPPCVGSAAPRANEFAIPVCR